MDGVKARYRRGDDDVDGRSGLDQRWGDVFLGGRAPEFMRVNRVGDDVVTLVDTPKGMLTR